MRVLPVASDAWRFVIPLGLIGGGLVYLDVWLARSTGCIFLVAAVLTLLFFRDFDRTTPVDDSSVYSPGDGEVLEVSQVYDANQGSCRMVRIFLSVLDGHVQRSPVSGRVKKIEYKKGTYLDARDPKAHLENERNAMTIETKNGPVVVTQVAGLIARRIVCWAKEGVSLKQGERYGLIRFGSQVDVALPIKSKVMVAVGDRVVGGRTVIARWIP